MAIFDSLHTGNSGVTQTFGNEEVTEDVKELIAEQAREYAELAPTVAKYIAIFDEEIVAVSDIRAYIKELGPKPNTIDIQAEYRARELYISFINRLKAKLPRAEE